MVRTRGEPAEIAAQAVGAGDRAEPPFPVLVGGGMARGDDEEGQRKAGVGRIHEALRFGEEQLGIVILTECDLLRQKQEGREIYYELKIEKMSEIDEWLDQFRKIMETSFQQLDQVLNTLKNKKK